jgi:hypothetical protein
MFEMKEDGIIHICRDSQTMTACKTLEGWDVFKDYWRQISADYCPYCGIKLPMTPEEIQDALDGKLEELHRFGQNLVKLETKNKGNSHA